MAYNQSGQRGPNIFLLLIHLVFGLYFINVPFSFVKIPESWAAAQPWIILIGGILIILGGFNYLKSSRRYSY